MDFTTPDAGHASSRPYTPRSEAISPSPSVDNEDSTLNNSTSKHRHEWGTSRPAVVTIRVTSSPQRHDMGTCQDARSPARTQLTSQDFIARALFRDITAWMEAFILLECPFLGPTTHICRAELIQIPPRRTAVERHRPATTGTIHHVVVISDVIST